MITIAPLISGAALREARRAHRISLRQLVGILRCDVALPSKVEKGQRDAPISWAATLRSLFGDVVFTAPWPEVEAALTRWRAEDAALEPFRRVPTVRRSGRRCRKCGCDPAPNRWFCKVCHPLVSAFYSPHEQGRERRLGTSAAVQQRRGARP
jgi:transcriptional regulator with XRE-family HTH domain